MRIRALTLAVLVGACSSAAADPVVAPPVGAPVEYTDGVVTVQVPAGAGPVEISVIPEPATLGLPETAVVYRFTGTATQATATIRVEAVWDGALPVLVGLVPDGAGGWEPVRTAAVAVVGGAPTVAVRLASLDTLAIVATGLAIHVDPVSGFASIGERWSAHWSLVAASADIGDTGPLVRSALAGEPAVPTTSEVVGDLTVSVEGRSDGAVASVGGAVSPPGVVIEPSASYPEGGTVVETVGGDLAFSCLAPGAGYHGASIELSGDGTAIGVPGEVSIRYDVAAPTRCEDHGVVLLERYLSGHLGLGGEVIAAVIAAIDARGGAVVGGFVLPPAAPVHAIVDSLAHPCGSEERSIALGVPVTVVCGLDPGGDDTGLVMVVAIGDLSGFPAVGFQGTVDTADDLVAGALAGADRTIRVEDVGGGARLVATTADAAPIPMSARVVRFGDETVWLVPLSEFDLEQPGFVVEGFGDETVTPTVRIDQ